MHSRLAAITLAALLASCTSTSLAINSDPIGANEVFVGMTEATASGFMLIDLIPIGQNSRFERAYEEARKKVRADRLVSVNIQESWYWCGVGNLYVFTLSGIGVRKK